MTGKIFDLENITEFLEICFGFFSFIIFERPVKYGGIFETFPKFQKNLFIPIMTIPSKIDGY